MVGIIIILCISPFLWGINNRQSIMNSDALSWRMSYISYLKENGYKYGISTYWNANITEFYSNGDIQVSPVYNDNDFTFQEWNTQKSNKEKKPEFILLEQNEYSERNDKDLYNIIYQDAFVVVLEYK